MPMQTLLVPMTISSFQVRVPLLSCGAMFSISCFCFLTRCVTTRCSVTTHQLGAEACSTWPFSSKGKSIVKDQGSFAKPKGVEAGAAIATSHRDLKQEERPIVKPATGTTNVRGATLNTAQHGTVFVGWCHMIRINS